MDDMDSLVYDLALSAYYLNRELSNIVAAMHAGITTDIMISCYKDKNKELSDNSYIGKAVKAIERYNNFLNCYERVKI